LDGAHQPQKLFLGGILEVPAVERVTFDGVIGEVEIDLVNEA
jgi:hypothetical protein